MQTYKVYVNGFLIGETELTESEVRNYNTLEGVTVKKA
jgi:hypothetical protein